MTSSVQPSDTGEPKCGKVRRKRGFDPCDFPAGHSGPHHWPPANLLQALIDSLERRRG